jgi:hypothetical protein
MQIQHFYLGRKLLLLGSWGRSTYQLCLELHQVVRGSGDFRMHSSVRVEIRKQRFTFPDSSLNSLSRKT